MLKPKFCRNCKKTYGFRPEGRNSISRRHRYLCTNCKKSLTYSYEELERYEF